MTDTPTPDESEQPEAAGEETPAEETPAQATPAEAAPAEAAPAGDVEAAPSSAVTPQAPAEPVPFWQRRNVDQFLVPLVLPVGVVAIIVFYVLNTSRLFLSVHGHIPVIVGTIITLTILIGAWLISSAARLRPMTVILTTVGFIFVLTTSGWISLGASENKEGGETALSPDLKVASGQEKKVTAAPGGALAFQPAEIAAKTGLVKFDVTFAAAGHTFAVSDPEALMPELEPTGTGTFPAVAYFGAPGDFEYECTIPGHASAGMVGTVHVTGDPVTLDQALTDAGNPPGASAG